jgi:hypothetical protein
MQYITQSNLLAPHHKTLSIEQLPSFQIVKEQPIVSAIPRGITNQRRVPRSWLLFPRLGGADAGGANRDRTDDLLLAKQALSQLSYGPAVLLLLGGGSGWIRTIDPRLIKTVL